MITRRWRGWTATSGNADAYVSHFPSRMTVLMIEWAGVVATGD